jgi:hypothetical protein
LLWCYKVKFFFKQLYCIVHILYDANIVLVNITLSLRKKTGKGRIVRGFPLALADAKLVRPNHALLGGSTGGAVVVAIFEAQRGCDKCA